MHEFFFHLIFHCAIIVFALRPPPRHKFSNGASLSRNKCTVNSVLGTDESSLILTGSKNILPLEL